MQKRLTFFIALFIGFSSLAQVNLDSLWNVWDNKAQHDTNRLKAMYEIVRDGYLYLPPDSAIYLAQMQYDLAERAGHKRWMANALNHIGYNHQTQGDYEEALVYFKRSLKIYAEISDKKGMANALNHIGYNHQTQGDYEEALAYLKRSLKIYRSEGLKEGIANSSNPIGVIYKRQGNFDEALVYFKRSLKIYAEIGDKKGMANIINNIGNMYDDQGNNEEALIHHKKSLTIREEIGDKYGISSSLYNIGVNYFDQGNYEKALIYYKKSLKIDEEFGDKYGISMTLHNIGGTYQNLGNFQKSITHSLEALSISKEINALDLLDEQSKALYQIYKELGNTNKALELYELHIATRDTLAKQDAMEEGIRLEEKRKYNEKKIIDSTAHIIAISKEKENVTRKEAELQIKKDQEIMLYGGLGLVVLFSLFIFNRFRVTYKQKNLIETQHHELNETHREITDSINYAKRIQSAILPPMKVVKEYLKESFIVYKPKDVVAGDFYWMEQKNGKVLFAAADCTGHGVPGAMVSVVCNNALNRSVREHGLTDPGEILNKTREIVVAEFEKSEEEVKDGMDIAICSLEGMKLQYAGAHNPLWIIRNGEIIETKANKQPIGQFENPVPYTTHSFDLEKGDAIYIFSDGYVDQFGGERGKKFKAKAFRELLLSIQDKAMEEQKKTIDETFETWKGDLEQIDDVCVIGVRV